jgi:hypothetical protein
MSREELNNNDVMEKLQKIFSGLQGIPRALVKEYSAKNPPKQVSSCAKGP